MIQLKNFVFNELEVNSFVLSDSTGECIIIDPGCNSPSQLKELTGYIEINGLKPVAIINTHTHFDHIFGNAALKTLYSCRLLIHQDDLLLLERVGQYAGFFGVKVSDSPLPDAFLEDGQSFVFGQSSLEIIHVPGHSPGSICLFSKSDHFLICGDVLFNGGVGRSDFPGGNHQLLLNGIREKLLILPPETVVWPGHGPCTTIQHEYDTNPFLN